MTERVDLYSSGGMASGLLTPAGRLADRLEHTPSIELDAAAWAPLFGPAAHASGRTAIAVDDVLIASDPNDDEPPIYAMWHPVLLELGPYQVRGELPTLPGFDPGRALTRPSGTFLRLRDVRVEIRDRPDLMAEHPAALVSRYGVERVRAGLDLGYFFPGATIEDAADIQPVGHISV